MAVTTPSTGNSDRDASRNRGAGLAIIEEFTKFAMEICSAGFIVRDEADFRCFFILCYVCIRIARPVLNNTGGY